MGAMEQLGGQVSAEVLEARLAKTNASREYRDAGDSLDDAKQELENWKGKAAWEVVHQARF
jgi:hypothetical protein